MVITEISFLSLRMTGQLQIRGNLCYRKGRRETLRRKNGLFEWKERLIRMERTAYSNGKNGLFDGKERLSALR